MKPGTASLAASNVGVIGPLLPAPSADRAARVAVVTGSYGAGHDAAARELATRLRGIGCEVETHDIVDLLPWRLGRFLRSAYYTQVRRVPGSWGTTLRLLEPGRRAYGLVTRLLALAARATAAAVGDCDLVLTTHPFAVQALGEARATGLLACPAVTYLTDSSVHALWVHPGIDLSLAIHRVAADDARRWGAVAAVVSPLVPQRTPAPGDDPLASLAVVGSRALVTGGSLGIGQLEEACRDILATGLMTPVALCGRDDALRRRLSTVPGVIALGWRDDLDALLAASDCVVQNAGGFTSLEALASGVPVITYRPIPGHGEANSANLEKAGLVPWARNPDDLALLLAAAKDAPRIDRLPSDAPDVVSVLTGERATLTAA